MIKNLLTRKSTLLEASTLLAATYLLSRILGVVRDGLLSARLGAGNISDAYTAAFAIPDFVFNLLILGALSSAFIPIFVEHLHKDGSGSDEAWGLVNTLVNFGIVLLSVILGVAAILAPALVHIVTPGFDPAKKEMVINMMRVMLLSPLFFGIGNLAGGILNSFHNFFAYALAPILYNVGIICGIVFLYPHFGYMGLAYGVVLGAFMTLVLQIPGVFLLGYRYRLKIDLKHPAFQRMAWLMLPRTIGLGIAQINDVLNGVVFASLLGAGSIWVWKTADDLLNVSIGVFGIPFAVAVFPLLAQQYTLKQLPEFADNVVKTARQILFFIVPSMMFYWLLRAQAVRLIYGHGAFGWEATRFTVTVLAFITFSLVAQALIPLLARAFYAMQDTKTPLTISLITLVLDVALAWPLMHQWKLVGLAVALSISTLVNLYLLASILAKRLEGFSWREIWIFLARIVPASVVMGGGGYVMLRVMDLIIDTHRTLGLAAQTGVTMIVMTLTYLAVCQLLKVPEVALVMRRLGRVAEVK